ncbi:MAG: hypothetical protein H0T73_22830 [Ardenticatenales bacterium]|nr:hypothetical protein [Ardenticatenales bacterium]
MAQFTKLSKEELTTFQSPSTGERSRVRDEYRGYLEGLSDGEGGELRLEGGEKKITVKNRLKRAAKDMNMALEFKRSGEGLVRFCVGAADN